MEGGRGNVIEGLTVQDNLGTPDSDYGDGIVLNATRDNVVRSNVVRRYGSFSGISLGRGAAGNEVAENTVTDNNMSHVPFPTPAARPWASGLKGRRAGGPEASHNRIIGNTVTGSGCDGIVVLATCDTSGDERPCVGTPPNEHNEIAGNKSSSNGTSGRGCGIRLFQHAAAHAADSQHHARQRVRRQHVLRRRPRRAAAALTGEPRVPQSRPRQPASSALSAICSMQLLPVERSSW